MQEQKRTNKDEAQTEKDKEENSMREKCNHNSKEEMPLKEREQNIKDKEEIGWKENEKKEEHRIRREKSTSLKENGKGASRRHYCREWKQDSRANKKKEQSRMEER